MRRRDAWAYPCGYDARLWTRYNNSLSLIYNARGYRQVCAKSSGTAIFRVSFPASPPRRFLWAKRQ